MSEPTASQRVVSMKPRTADLEKLVRRLAANSGNVRWGPHCFDRQEERGIFDTMMFEVLRTGYLKGDVEPGKNEGEWKVKMCKQMKGRREVGVVTVIINRSRLFVKTVEWEDAR